MSSVSHQTIKLGRGKHSSPDDGACVMELASMLSGERFTDHPDSVCPAIGSFLRAYNDSIDDERRQALYAYASRVVGSRSTEMVEHERVDRLLAWASELRPHRLGRWLPSQLHWPRAKRRPPVEAAGTHAVHAIRKHTDASHAAALALLDELLVIGHPGPAPELPAGRPAEPRLAKTH